MKRLIVALVLVSSFTCSATTAEAGCHIRPVRAAVKAVKFVGGKVAKLLPRNR